MLRLTYEELFKPGGVLDEASTLTYDKLFKRSDPKRIWRSGQVRGPPLEIDSYKDAIYHTFNFKSYPSTTGLRHRGYIKFERPTHGRPTPSEKLPVVVDCDCPDYRYRWAWSNKQRGASRIGSQSLNQAINRAPRKTNPNNKIGLCVAEGELVRTRRGYVPIEHVKAGDLAWTMNGWKTVTAAQKTGEKEIVDVVTRTGKKLRVTGEHQIYVFDNREGFKWLPAASLTKEHYTCCTISPDIAESHDYPSVHTKASDKGLHYNECGLKLDETLAEIFGYMTAERSVDFFAAKTELLRNDFSKKWKSLFGDESCSISEQGCKIGVNGSRILKQLGFVFGSYNKVVPDWIMKSRKSVIVAFLRGCYAGDGNFRSNHSTYATVSEKLARNLQILLDLVGVRTTLKQYVSGCKKSLVWTIRTSSYDETTKLFSLLRPLRGHSSGILSKPSGKSCERSRHDYILHKPHILFKRIIAESLPVGDSTQEVNLASLHEFVPEAVGKANFCEFVAKLLKNQGLLSKKRIRAGGKPNNIAKLSDINRVLRGFRARRIWAKLTCPKSYWRQNRFDLSNVIDQLKEVLPSAYEKLNTLLRQDVYFDQVVSVTPAGKSVVYDLSVPGAEHFTVQGIVVHNCKHLLACKNYIYGLIQRFDRELPASQRHSGRGVQDMDWKLNQLVKYANKRWINLDQQTKAGKRRQQIQRQVQQARNVAGPMPAAEVPPNIDNELPVPLPADMEPAEPAVPPVERDGGIPENPPVNPPAAPVRRRNRNREESTVVRSAANTIIVEIMSKELLNKTRAIVEALEHDQNLADEVTNATLADTDGIDSAPEAEVGELPPPPPEEMADEMGAEGAPEDEALGLLRDIASGIGRLADELAPAEPPEDENFGKPEGEPEDDSEDDEDAIDPGVPPVEDDDDFSETMPVSSGA